MKLLPTGSMKLVCEFQVSEPEGAKFAHEDQGPESDVAVVYLLSFKGKVIDAISQCPCEMLHRRLSPFVLHPIVRTVQVSTALLISLPSKSGSPVS